MNILGFTVEETNLIAIYADGGTQKETIASITHALPDMGSSMRGIAERAAAKLTAMNAEDFASAAFVLADEDEGESGSEYEIA